MSKYNFKDTKYDSVRSYIHNLVKRGNDYSSVENLESFGSSEMTTAEKFGLIKQIATEFINSEYDISLDEWRGLVKYEKKESEKEIYGVNTAELNDYKISGFSKAPDSQWQLYKNQLGEKEFSAESILNIEKASLAMVKRLKKDTTKSGPVKGLAVGGVQSGKTANMIGLMSMAADYGFNFFIIFSGTIDSLRLQTEDRMYSDLNLSGSQFSWERLNKPSLSSQEPNQNWANIDVNSNSDRRYFSVNLKHKTNMDKLINWIYSDDNKVKQIKALIIDDEADQASINTKVSDDDITAINGAMRKLVNGKDGKKFKASNYISYTATPYANVLNEIGEDTLFPKDFVYPLPLNGDYIGPKQIFGLNEPNENARLPIVNSIPNGDLEQIKEIHDGNYLKAPKSLKEAITWFFITACINRIYDRKKPVSMLIHTSHLTSTHSNIEMTVKSFLLEIQLNQEQFFEFAETLYVEEKSNLSRATFLKGMENYTNKDDVRDYPPFEEVKKQLKVVLNKEDNEYISHIPLNDEGELTYHSGFHVVVNNSNAATKTTDDEYIRLYYPKKDQKVATMFIVIGGNTLSRGLTLEGLTSTYFARNSKNADSLFQMGRWFGYRKGYELLPRIWMTNDSRSRFEYIAQINEDLINGIVEMGRNGQTPEVAGVKIRNSPDYNFLRVTAPNKSSSVVETDIDFSGTNKQTIYFKEDKKDLEDNLKLTQRFLNNLEEMEISNNNFVWRDIPQSLVEEYLTNFHFSDRSAYFSNISTIMEWFKEVNEDSKTRYSGWNIILVNNKNSKEIEPDENWLIHEKIITASMRSKLRGYLDDGKTVDIKSLVSSADMGSDLPKDIPKDDKITGYNSIKINRVRNDYELGKTPQLLLYKIDKDAGRSTDEREPLDFPADIIGMNIFIPGQRNYKNMAKNLTVNIPFSNSEGENYDEE